jgi:hypothetical protein
LDDRLAFDALNNTWTSTGLQGEDDDDGFILKAPPRPVQLRDSTGTSLASLNVSTACSSVPSLFSLSHPLDDVLPISNLPDGDLHQGPVTDVFEKVLVVGVLRWTDPSEAVIDRKEYSQPICVIHHTPEKVG